MKEYGLFLATWDCFPAFMLLSVYGDDQNFIKHGRKITRVSCMSTEYGKIEWVDKIEMSKTH